MHVSPFFGMDQTYRFSFTEPGERDPRGGGHHRGRRRGRSGPSSPGAAGPSTNASLARALDPLSADVAAGHRPHPLAGAEARDEAGPAPPQAARSRRARARWSPTRAPRRPRPPRRGLRPLPPAGAHRSPRAPAAWPSGGCATRRAGRSRCACPTAASTAAATRRPGPAVDVIVRSTRPLPAARRPRAARRSARPTRPATGAPTTWSGCSRSWRSPARRAPTARRAGASRQAPPAPPPAAGARRPARRPARHPVPLRPRQRLLRALPRPVVDLLVRRSSSAPT